MKDSALVTFIKEAFKFAKAKGVGDLCLLLACLACFLAMISAAGWEPLNLGITRRIATGVFSQADAKPSNP